MAGLSWMLGTMAVFLLTADCLNVDQTELARIVAQTLNKFTQPSKDDKRTLPMFSLAVSIPFNSKFYDVKKVPDTHEAVRNTILNCEVYTGQNVVAATRLKWPEAATVCPDGPVLWPDVRQQCPAGITWSQLKRAPCVHRCTKTDSERNILESIQKIRNWQNYAVVFTNIPKHANGEDIDLSEKKQALLNLGTFEFNSGSIGLENIFRCKYIHGNMQCASCSTKGDVTDYCITDGTGTEAGGASAKGAGMMG